MLGFSHHSFRFACKSEELYIKIKPSIHLFKNKWILGFYLARFCPSLFYYLQANVASVRTITPVPPLGPNT